MDKLSLPAALRGMERLIGFTIPRGGRFYVCDHDEVVQVNLTDVLQDELLDIHPYKFVENNSDFLGLVFEGLAKNEPVHRVGSNTISYTFNPADEFVEVRYEAENSSGSLQFPTFSGDWFVASLSDDGRYLILADPYEIAAYRLT